MTDEQKSTATAGVVIIDQTAIYNTLIEVRDVVLDVKKDVASLKDTGVDHETRIRALEKRVWVAAGLAMAGGAGLNELIGRVLGS